MDPLTEYLLQKEYARRQDENLAKSIGIYDEEYENQNIIGAGPSLSGVDNIEYPLLSIIPPGYKMVPWYLVNDSYYDFEGGIIKLSKQWNRPFARTLLHTLGKGLIIGGMYPELYGGFRFGDIKKKIEKAKKDVKNVVKNPFDFTKEVVSYVGDIIPTATKYAAKIVEDPLEAPKLFKNYVEQIMPIAKKHAKSFDKKVKQKGGCCSECAIGKKCKGGYRGGISASILGDPVFLKKLEKQRNMIEEIEILQDELAEDYEEAIEEGDAEKANEISQEINSLDVIKEEIEDENIEMLDDDEYMQIENRKMEVIAELDDEYKKVEEELEYAYDNNNEDQIEELEEELYNLGELIGHIEEIEPEDFNIPHEPMDVQIQNNIYNMSQPNFYPEDYTDNSRSMTLRPIDRQQQCPELDVSYEMIVSYINFIYPDLPEYVRITMSNNLYQSIIS